jgi:D-sedoheptulose 7-phosphate isomerase
MTMNEERVLKALYPFLHGEKQEAAKLDAALLYSVEEKARDSRGTNQRFFGEQAGVLVAAAGAVADVYRRGGRLFSMGNGGSSATLHMSPSSSCIPSPPGARRSPRSISSRTSP